MQRGVHFFLFMVLCNESTKRLFQVRSASWTIFQKLHIQKIWAPHLVNTIQNLYKNAIINGNTCFFFKKKIIFCQQVWELKLGKKDGNWRIFDIFLGKNAHNSKHVCFSQYNSKSLFLMQLSSFDFQLGLFLMQRYLHTSFWGKFSENIWASSHFDNTISSSYSSDWNQSGKLWQVPSNTLKKDCNADIRTRIYCLRSLYPTLLPRFIVYVSYK